MAVYLPEHSPTLDPLIRLPRPISLIQPGNPASERVGEKTGVQRIETLRRHGRTNIRYEIENPDA